MKIWRTYTKRTNEYSPWKIDASNDFEALKLRKRLREFASKLRSLDGTDQYIPFYSANVEVQKRKGHEIHILL